MNLSSRFQTHNIDEVIAALSSGSHRAGTLRPDVIKGIIDLLPPRDIHSVETGCGKSTIAFSNVAKRHLSFCYDDRDVEDSSVSYVLAHRLFVPERTSFVFGPTQVTLPQYDFEHSSQFDLVLIDGPHGFPFPDLEYWHLYPRIASGGLLVIDDLMIPSIGRMYDILREDRMFEEVAVLGTTGILRRSHEPPLPQDGDHWWEQAYNFRRFPLTMQPYRKEFDYNLGAELDFSNGAVCSRHCLRGFEHRPGVGAATVDTSAVLRFRCDAPAGSELRLRLQFRITSLSDCAGATIHANRAFAMELPASGGEVDVEFSCPADSSSECYLEFRLPAAKPIHDTQSNFNFRRAALALHHFSARLNDKNDPGVTFHRGGPLEVSLASQAIVEAPSNGAILSAPDFISTINRLCDVVGISSPALPNPREIMPPPVLCPNAASSVRFLPLRGIRYSAEPTGVSAMLPLSGKNWSFVDFFAFEGEEFAYAVLRSLLHRAPNKKQIQLAASDTTDKLFLVLASDYKARRIGKLGKFKDLPLARLLYRLWRALRKSRLQLPANAVRSLIGRSAKNAYTANRRRLEERRFLLNALGALSGTARKN